MKIQSQISFFIQLHKLFKCSGVKCLLCGSNSPTFLLSVFEFKCTSLPEFRACLIPRESEQTEALPHWFLLKSIRVKPEGHEIGQISTLNLKEKPPNVMIWNYHDMLNVFQELFCDQHFLFSHFSLHLPGLLYFFFAEWHHIKSTGMLVASIVLANTLQRKGKANMMMLEQVLPEVTIFGCEGGAWEDILIIWLRRFIVGTCQSQGSHALNHTPLYHPFDSIEDLNLQNEHLVVLKKTWN